MIRRYYLVIYYALLLYSPFVMAHDNKIKNDRDIKILVLIIASDDFPVYTELQKIWRSYMNYDSEHVKAYFIRGNPKLPQLYQFDGDVIWSQTTEGWIPKSAGILNKTILSLEALLPQMHNFDYILRTNLSSFYIFPRLLNFLKIVPKKRCYCGSNIGGTSSIASGCGFLISPDVAEMIVHHKDSLLNNASSEDDVLLGTFITGQGISLIQHPRMDFLTLQEWDHRKDKIPSTMFHFRMKFDHELRLKNEIPIQSALLKMFYT